MVRIHESSVILRLLRPTISESQKFWRQEIVLLGRSEEFERFEFFNHHSSLNSQWPLSEEFLYFVVLQSPSSKLLQVFRNLSVPLAPIVVVLKLVLSDQVKFELPLVG